MQIGDIMSFSNKVVIVTGASSGIGAATAVLFSKEGADVVMVGRNATKLKNVAEKCEKNGKKPLVVNADVSKEADVERIVKETIDKFGKIDVLVNNAGIIRLGSVLDGKILKAYDEIMATNLRPILHMTSLAAPYLIKTKGNIVNVSSVAGQMVMPFHPLNGYGISKAGLDHFSRNAALELAPHGVRLNVISPGPVKTDLAENSGFKGAADVPPMTPLKRVSESEEIADLIAFLASEKARGITGSIFVTDNGSLLKTDHIDPADLKKK